MIPRLDAERLAIGNPMSSSAAVHKRARTGDAFDSTGLWPLPGYTWSAYPPSFFHISNELFIGGSMSSLLALE
jgi:hypothetical protein